VWRFSLATSRSKKTATGGWEDITDWHSCQYWGNLPKNAGKGALMALAGTLESWKSGDKSGWQVNVNDVRVLTKGEEVAAAAPAPEPAVSQEQLDTYTKALNDKFGEVKIEKLNADELPF
jgi:single-stranded DNA-binding protein